MARRNKRAAYDPLEEALRSILRIIPLTVLIGILLSIVTVYFWGWKEYFRMMLQGLLGVTLAAAIFGSVIKRWERKLQR